MPPMASVPILLTLLFSCIGIIIVAFCFYVGQMYTTSKLLLLAAIPVMIAAIVEMPAPRGELPTSHLVGGMIAIALVMLALFAHTRTAK